MQIFYIVDLLLVETKQKKTEKKQLKLTIFQLENLIIRITKNDNRY